MTGSWPLTSGCRATQTQPEFCLADSGRCWHCPPIPESRRQMRLKYFVKWKDKIFFFLFFPYFQEVVFLSVVVSVMCQIFSRWLKLNVLLIMYNINILKRKPWLVAMDALNQSKYSLLIIFNSLQIPTQLYR